MNIYDVVLKRGDSEPNIVEFYDEDREKAIKAMLKYRKKHGFSVDTPKGTFAIRNIILRERKSTGETVKETPYCEIFDALDRRIDDGR